MINVGESQVIDDEGLKLGEWGGFSHGWLFYFFVHAQ